MFARLTIGGRSADTEGYPLSGCFQASQTAGKVKSRSPSPQRWERPKPLLDEFWNSFFILLTFFVIGEQIGSHGETDHPAQRDDILEKRLISGVLSLLISLTNQRRFNNALRNSWNVFEATDSSTPLSVFPGGWLISDVSTLIFDVPEIRQKPLVFLAFFTFKRGRRTPSNYVLSVSLYVCHVFQPTRLYWHKW